LALIEELTPQFHQDLFDGESSNVLPNAVAKAACKKYGAIIQERIIDKTKGMYVLAGHVQQLVQKLQRSPFFGIVVQVCAALQSKVVGKETYENDILPLLNKAQRKDFAVFMKRIRDTRAQHAAAVEQLRAHLQGQKISLVVSARYPRLHCSCASQFDPSITAGKDESKIVSHPPFSSQMADRGFDFRFAAGFVTQRELFDILISARINANEAKSGILSIDPLVHLLLLLYDDDDDNDDDVFVLLLTLL
jgi:hypothetical protein